MSARYTRFRPRNIGQRDRVRVLAEHVGTQLRQQREALKLTQERVATAAGFWQTGVSRLEKGRPVKLTVDALFRLVDELGLSIELVPRDAAISRYREERERAAARRSQRELFTESSTKLREVKVG
jgi:transcriptional regulator with XRE-family HTH domain